MSSGAHSKLLYEILNTRKRTVTERAPAIFDQKEYLTISRNNRCANENQENTMYKTLFEEKTVVKTSNW